ncbi:hypothetical protein [Billgrantia endophytica]|uniref:Uncharacterized protein n=1 Tax=Billgrantia endophytica TaxID=2033802 RepID=A0A2N7U7J7_9GAMM|nr:hypothetical protein [Halomonas endophytica]PMR76416.1 hypothetical protein C1H69_05030 [Halomonas endophytica]
MKYATIMMKTMAAGALALGLISQAAAMGGTGARTLEPGTSTLQQVAGTQRYALEVGQASQLDIRSRNVVGYAGAPHFRLNGVLLDEQRNVVGTAEQVGGGQIALNQAVQPGRYVFEVRGNVLGGKREGVNQYILQTRLL